MIHIIKKKLQLLFKRLSYSLFKLLYGEIKDFKPAGKDDSSEVLKSILSEESKNIKDKATKIKITEVAKLLTELDKAEKVGDNNLVDLLQYYELVKEIQVANAVQV